MKRIVIATIGSLGDLHPYMALALGLQKRGHQVLIAAPALYRERVEKAGVSFEPLGSNLLMPDQEVYARILNLRKGVEHLFRDLMMPTVRETYNELHSIVNSARADLLVSSPIVFAAPLVAEKMNLPWVSTVLAPLSFFSTRERFDLPGVPSFLTFWGGGLRMAADLGSRHWSKPIADLRKKLRLTRMKANPLLDGQHSPKLVLAMFSSVLGAPKEDWPAQARQTGFCFYDEEAELDPALVRFLDSGPPPIVFTLGSTAVNAPRNFYEEGAAVAKLLGRRALLIGAKNMDLPEGVEAFEYAPYAAVFPRAAAVVHQGGVGTTAQVLRAGVPSLIVPFNFDQPDNAARIARMGVGRKLALKRFKAKSAAKDLRSILDDLTMVSWAREVAHQIASEDGVAAACDFIGP